MRFHWALFTSLGLTVVSAPLVSAYAHDKNPSEENEKQITLAEVPAAARATLVKAAAGGKITKVESETENGKPIFEAHVQPAQGKEFAVKVDPTGKLLGKGAEKE